MAKRCRRPWTFKAESDEAKVTSAVQKNRPVAQDPKWEKSQSCFSGTSSGACASQCGREHGNVTFPFERHEKIRI